MWVWGNLVGSWPAEWLEKFRKSLEPGCLASPRWMAKALKLDMTKPSLRKCKAFPFLHNKNGHVLVLAVQRQLHME